MYQPPTPSPPAFTDTGSCSVTPTLCEQDAYRQLAMKAHPDSEGANADRDRFELLAAAYEVLSDPGKRSTYDQVRIS